MDASHLNIHLLEILVSEFPESQFILTIRDCYSRLDSTINHRLARLYSFEKRAWIKHLQNLRRVLSTLPSERLLVVKTRELTQSIPQIEKFLGIIPGSLPTSARGNVTTQKFNILSQIDKNFLEGKANFRCKELMDKYFPKVKGFN